MRLLSRMLLKRKFFSLAAVCAGLFAAALTLRWNSQLISIIDSVGAGKKPTGEMIFVSLAIMLAMGLINFIKAYASGYACEIISHDLRTGYARNLSRIPYAETENLNAGEQLSKLQNEIAGASDYLNKNFYQLFDDGIRFAITFAWLLALNPALTLSANAPAFLILVYVVWSSKIIGVSAERSLNAKGEMNRHSETLLSLFPVIKLFDAARMVSCGFESAVGEWRTQTIRMERVKALLMSLSGVLSGVPLLFIFLIGGGFAIDGAITVGGLYVFINLSGNVSGVLMNMPGQITAYRQFAAGMKRLEGRICL